MPSTTRKPSIRFLAIATGVVFSALSTVGASLAADVEKGRQFAQSMCAGCHAVTSGRQKESSDAPPFDFIARKYGADVDMLAFALLSPHPKMNIPPTRRQAVDIAAYIATLAN